MFFLALCRVDKLRTFPDFQSYWITDHGSTLIFLDDSEDYILVIHLPRSPSSRVAEVGVRKLMTSSLSHFGYVFKFGEQSWRKAHHPNLTLAEAGVKAGDTVQFTGDFEVV